MITNQHPNLTIITSEKSDGNVRNIEGNDSTKTLERQKKLAKAAKSDEKHTLRVRVNYEREDFCRFIADPEAEEYGLSAGEKTPVADGILITNPKYGIFLPLADCLGIILHDPTKKHLMLIHAGRHTLEQKGATKAIKFMTDHGSQPEDIIAHFSPSAGSKNYPLHKFAGQSMAEVATSQLIKAGLQAKNIHQNNIDTTTNPRFYSHSTGDTHARFGILVKMA